VVEDVGSRTPRTPSGPTGGARSGSHSVDQRPRCAVLTKPRPARRRDSGRAEPTRPPRPGHDGRHGGTVTPMPPADLRTFLMRGRTRLMLVVLVRGLTSVRPLPATTAQRPGPNRDAHHRQHTAGERRRRPDQGQDASGPSGREGRADAQAPSLQAGRKQSLRTPDPRPEVSATRGDTPDITRSIWTEDRPSPDVLVG
jgi:hypothetical protein